MHRSHSSWKPSLPRWTCTWLEILSWHMSSYVFELLQTLNGNVAYASLSMSVVLLVLSLLQNTAFNWCHTTVHYVEQSTIYRYRPIARYLGSDSIAHRGLFRSNLKQGFVWPCAALFITCCLTIPDVSASLSSGTTRLHRSWNIRVCWNYQCLHWGRSLQCTVDAVILRRSNHSNNPFEVPFVHTPLGRTSPLSFLYMSSEVHDILRSHISIDVLVNISVRSPRKLIIFIIRKIVLG